jgi:hypothetical protein
MTVPMVNVREVRVASLPRTATLGAGRTKQIPFSPPDGEEVARSAG